MFEHQICRYAIVGGIAFIIDWTALYCLTEFGQMHYLASAAAAFIVGVTTNYLLSLIWVFAVRAVADCRIEFAVFAGIGMIGLGLNELLIWFFTERLAVYYMVSKLLAAGLVFFWNFYARKVILFSDLALRYRKVV